ncbi:MAG: RNase adapter RapZ [Caldisericia bacterium]|nr:RNase adapter RapZ [Caldisericia bacterium]
MNLLIITGLSGAGKTHCIKILEDLGYFCVDNLPLKLLSGFASLVKDLGKDESKPTAVVVDIREGSNFVENLFDALSKLEEDNITYRIIFLEANDEILVRRFSETRRRHPLSRDGSILTAIMQEKALLASIREKANFIIDTSDFTVKDLREKLNAILSLVGNSEEENLTVNIVAFGFKSGIPIDADIVMDVRFLPNPFYESSLKDLNGLSEEVSNYVTENEIGKNFLDKLLSLLLFILPLYKKEGKSQATIAFGCTGGKHRSVAIANAVKNILIANGYKVNTLNRDLE